jgi:hypothetical protein
MLYLPVFGFAIFSILRWSQGNFEECILFAIVAGIYLIPATMQNIYDQWVEKKALEYKAMSEVFEKWANDIKEKQKEQEKKI